MRRHPPAGLAPGALMRGPVFGRRDSKQSIASWSWRRLSAMLPGLAFFPGLPQDRAQARLRQSRDQECPCNETGHRTGFFLLLI